MTEAIQDAVIIGATGGIGRAFVRALAADPKPWRIHAFSRSGAPVTGADAAGIVDYDAPETLAEAAAAVAAPRLVIIATGMLHEGAMQPEKSLRAIDPTALARAYHINAIGPALAMRAFLPRLPREGRSVFAALSARVGSISDNRLGGWYGYRASKAGLNMLLRAAAIELARTRPEAICVGLHPGTTDTDLSRPFQGGVAPAKLFTPDYSAGRMLAVLADLTPALSGRLFAWDGEEIEP